MNTSSSVVSPVGQIYAVGNLKGGMKCVIYKHSSFIVCFCNNFYSIDYIAVIILHIT